MTTNDRRFAVLIDADNVGAKYIKIILDEISNDGEVTYKRIYGDWTKPALSPWKQVLLENSVTPIQQYSYTTGKNATDSAMIIDAMDILYSGRVEGFCLVTSDSDFTRLASRLRESGMMVVGMGEKKTPKAFVSACNKFKYLDILAGGAKGSKAKAKESRDAVKESAKEAAREVVKDARDHRDDRRDDHRDDHSRDINAKKGKPVKPNEVKVKPAEKTVEKQDKLHEAAEKSEAVEIIEKDPRTGKYNAKDMGILFYDDDESEAEVTSLEDITDALRSILREESDEDGWVSTSDLGNRLLKRYSDFDVRNYGYAKLTQFLKSLKGFEMKSVKTDNSSVKMVFLREFLPDRD